MSLISAWLPVTAEKKQARLIAATQFSKETVGVGERKG